MSSKQATRCYTFLTLIKATNGVLILHRNENLNVTSALYFAIEENEGVKQEISALKGIADSNGAKKLSQNKVEITNHFEKIDITYFLTWGKKLWNTQLDPHNPHTHDEHGAL